MKNDVIIVISAFQDRFYWLKFLCLKRFFFFQINILIRLVLSYRRIVFFFTLNIEIQPQLFRLPGVV